MNVIAVGTDIRIEKKANYAWYLAVQSSASLKRTGNKNPSIVIHDTKKFPLKIL